MKLQINNIGKVIEADIEINGISVIAGENNTGKSTVGKALYAVFNSASFHADRIRAERIVSIKKAIDSLLITTGKLFFQTKTSVIAETIVDNAHGYLSGDDSLLKDLKESLAKEGHMGFREEDIMQSCANIERYLQLSDDAIFVSVVEGKLRNEFAEQVKKADAATGSIKLTIRGNEISIEIVKDQGVRVNKRSGLQTEVIYLDDLSVLDFNRYVIGNRLVGHMEELRLKLIERRDVNTIERIVNEDRLKKIIDAITAVCDGNVVVSERNEIEYQQGKEMINIRNLSMGLKTFAILKLLLLEGHVRENGTIILDEPEIHLHPEWQLILAEIIVMLQVEYGLHILINTHSPYFMRAIQVYAAKHEVADKCKYYLATQGADGAYINDVSDDVEKIYSLLARPIRTLEDEVWKD